LSNVWMITDGISLSLSLSHTHTHTHKIMSSLPLLGSGFQRRMFPFLWFFLTVPGQSYQLLTTTEP
jgi:hypothetical protein